jgi:hypothetical protein
MTRDNVVDDEIVGQRPCHEYPDHERDGQRRGQCAAQRKPLPRSDHGIRLLPRQCRKRGAHARFERFRRPVPRRFRPHRALEGDERRVRGGAVRAGFEMARDVERFATAKLTIEVCREQGPCVATLHLRLRILAARDT